MIASIVNGIITDRSTTIYLGLAIWLIIAANVLNRKARKFVAPLHIIGSTAYLAFTFFTHSGNSRYHLYS